MPRLPLSIPLTRRRSFGRVTALAALAALIVAVACGEAVPVLTITSPAHGTFTTATSVTVTGSGTVVPANDLALTLNGVATPINPDGTFSASVPISQAAILNPIVARLRKVSNNVTVVQRIMVVGGQAVADGQFSASSLGMRINDTGLNQLEPTIQSLINGSFNIQSLILAANPIISNYCVINIFGCIASVNVNATSVTYTQPVGVNLDAVTNFTNVAVTVNNIRVNYNVSGAFSCTGHLTATTTNVNGVYDQIPAVPASTVNVNQSGNVSVGFNNFNNSFDSGICDFPLIGDIIQLVIGDVQPLVVSGLVTNLADPDGSGPADAPIAAAIQSTLSGLQIAGPIGTSLGVDFDAEFSNVAEDSVGLTYRLDARIMSPALPTVPGPNQLYSYNPPETFPTFGANSPIGNLPYGLGLSIGPGTFNQLLKAEVESSGLLQIDVTSFQGIPLTAGILALFLPEFSSLNPYYPMTFRIRPTLSPFITGLNGPGGEMADLRAPHVIGSLIGLDSLGAEIEYVRVAFDVRAGLVFAFDNGTTSLVPTIGAVSPSDVTVAVLSSINNPPGEAALQALLPQLIATVLPTLGTALGTFPLPSFLGLNLDFVAIGKVNQSIGLFVNLTP